MLVDRISSCLFACVIDKKYERERVKNPNLKMNDDECTEKELFVTLDDEGTGRSIASKYTGVFVSYLRVYFALTVIRY